MSDEQTRDRRKVSKPMIEDLIARLKGERLFGYAEEVEILFENWTLGTAEGGRMRSALESIAANTCCGDCQEAALVAKAALVSGSQKRPDSQNWCSLCESPEHPGYTCVEAEPKALELFTWSEKIADKVLTRIDGGWPHSQLDVCAERAIRKLLEHCRALESKYIDFCKELTAADSRQEREQSITVFGIPVNIIAGASDDFVLFTHEGRLVGRIDIELPFDTDEKGHK